MLEIINFRKSYKKNIVLQIDDLHITSGINWLRGANGTGKSTFLKAAAGIIPFEGDLVLDSRVSIKKQSVEYRKVVNFAEAEPLFPDFLTGLDLISLFASAKRAEKKQEDYFIETMEMGSYISNPIRGFSSGMLKKLSLLLAFIGNPALILLDEPLTTIDAESVKILYTWIAGCSKERGVSFLLSSHQAFMGQEMPVVKEILVEYQTLKYT